MSHEMAINRRQEGPTCAVTGRASDRWLLSTAPNPHPLPITAGPVRHPHECLCKGHPLGHREDGGELHPALGWEMAPTACLFLFFKLKLAAFTYH